jgi:hypothetical protein
VCLTASRVVFVKAIRESYIVRADVGRCHVILSSLSRWRMRIVHAKPACRKRARHADPRRNAGAPRQIRFNPTSDGFFLVRAPSGGEDGRRHSGFGTERGEDPLLSMDCCRRDRSGGQAERPSSQEIISGDNNLVSSSVHPCSRDIV